MASVASQLTEEVTAHVQGDSPEYVREICADSTYFPNNLRISEFGVESGVKQGDPLSQTLFSLVINTVLKKLDLRGNIST